MNQPLRAVYEAGVFRPLEAVELTEHQEVTLVLQIQNGEDEQGSISPIWEFANELARTLPADEWNRLPTDGAAGLCHLGVWAGRFDALDAAFSEAADAAGATLLDIKQAHVIETARLPGIHEDPFDRLIIAQARIENAVAVSSDSRWGQYEVSLRRPWQG